MNIPKYRAKKIDSDEYVEGYYTKTKDSLIVGNTGKNWQHFIDVEELELDINTFLSDSKVSVTKRLYAVDPSTLAINFPDMLDSNNKPIFASLSESGKGGDIGQCFDYGENKYTFVYNDSTFEFGIKLIIEKNTDKECWEYSCLKDECLEIFKIIGIQS